MMMTFMLGLFVGCTQWSPPQTHSTAKHYNMPQWSEGLTLRIFPEDQNTVDNEGILFLVEVKNTGERPLIISQNPVIQFFWTFRNGRRDNQILDIPTSNYVEQNQVVLLQPGEMHTVRKNIDPESIHKTGMVDFQAVLYSGHNENQEMVAWWEGKVVSNKIKLRLLQVRHGISYINTSSVAKTKSLTGLAALDTR